MGALSAMGTLGSGYESRFVPRSMYLDTIKQDDDKRFAWSLSRDTFLAPCYREKAWRWPSRPRPTRCGTCISHHVCHRNGGPDFHHIDSPDLAGNSCPRRTPVSNAATDETPMQAHSCPRKAPRRPSLLPQDINKRFESAFYPGMETTSTATGNIANATAPKHEMEAVAFPWQQDDRSFHHSSAVFLPTLLAEHSLIALLADIEGAQSQSFSKFINRGDEAKVGQSSVTAGASAEPSSELIVFGFPQEHMSKIWRGEKYMHPTRLHPETTNRPELCLNTKDVPGASPANARFSDLERGTNPLQPQYVLPGHSERPQPPDAPRFIRDSFDVSDIQGTSSSTFQSSREGFTTLHADDIDGAYVGWKPYYRAHFNTAAGQRDHIGVSDINTTSRIVFPTRNPYPDGDVEGSKPRPLTRGRGEGEMLDVSLRTDDIQGARTRKTKDNINDPWVGKLNRRRFKETNFIDDIDGARAVSAEAAGVSARHAAIASATRHLKACASGAVSAMTRISADKDTLRALNDTLLRFDREKCGKVSAFEFSSAVESAGLGVCPDTVAGLRSGLADTAGLVDYRPLLKALSSNATKGLPPRPSFETPPMSRPVSGSGSTSSQSSRRPCSAPSRHGSCRGSPGSPRRQTDAAGGSASPSQAWGVAAPEEKSAVAFSSPGPPPAKGQDDGPQSASVADIVARAGQLAAQRKQRAQSARAVSYKKAHTEDGKPKYWFGSMGATADTTALNKSWRMSVDKTMLDQSRGLADAAAMLPGDGGPAGKPHRAASAKISRAATATPDFRHEGLAPRPRPFSAMMSLAGSGSSGHAAHKTIRMAPTATFRPSPKATHYTGGAKREAEILREDIATVRNLM